MDSLIRSQEIIETILTDYARDPYAYGDVTIDAVFDRSRNRYLLMLVGWESDERRVHGCLVHLDIIDGKIWVQRDGTEIGMAPELMRAGIAKDQIVLAFHHPRIRKHTEFAVS